MDHLVMVKFIRLVDKKVKKQKIHFKKE